MLFYNFTEFVAELFKELKMKVRKKLYIPQKR